MPGGLHGLKPCTWLMNVKEGPQRAADMSETSFEGLVPKLERTKKKSCRVFAMPCLNFLFIMLMVGPKSSCVIKGVDMEKDVIISFS